METQGLDAAVMERPPRQGDKGVKQRLEQIVNGFSILPSFLEDSVQYVFNYNSIPEQVKIAVLARFTKLHHVRESNKIEVARAVSEELTRVATRAQCYDIGLLTQAFEYARKEVSLMEARKPLNYDNLMQVRNSVAIHRKQAYKNLAKITAMLLSQQNEEVRYKEKLAEELLGYDRKILALSKRLENGLDIAMSKMYVADDLVRLAGIYLTKVEKSGKDEMEKDDKNLLLMSVRRYKSNAVRYYNAAKKGLKKASIHPNKAEFTQFIDSILAKVETGLNDKTQLDERLKAYSARSAAKKVLATAPTQ